jgi:ABC-type branched-subunit amino acid transport system substrate-binding protein
MNTLSHLSRLISSLCCVFALVGVFTVTSASAKDQIVLCTIDDLSGDFSIMSTPKTYGYKLAVKEINDAGGIQVDGAKKTIKLVS